MDISNIRIAESSPAFRWFDSTSNNFYRVSTGFNEWKSTSSVTRGRRRSTMRGTKLRRGVSSWKLSSIHGYCFVWYVRYLFSYLPSHSFDLRLGKKIVWIEKAYPRMRGELQRKHWMLYGVKTAIKPQRSSQLCFSEIRGQS
jgi:hypothetical protein